MGLDTVELLMTIEEEFGIHIDDDDASNLTTPAEAANYVYTRVRTSKKDPCLSQKGFYKLRNILTKSFNAERNSIKPDTDLNIFLGSNIKGNWKLLKELIAVRDFPHLKRSNTLFYSAVLIVPIIIITPLLLYKAPIELILVSFMLLSLVFNGITYKMANIIPAKYTSVGSLIPYVECNENRIWEKEDIIQRIIKITSEQLGIPVEQIDNNSHFVHDLGAD